MSRRPPNPAAERAARNQATLKNLLKLEANKMCADCKRNKHPRWASWNIGVFVCIRCSGIHRSMGTHISRVKSVDLDAWTDEQLQSILNWGNVRANKYWEAKLAAGHVPSEAKIENFIRTKYELKRWVMDGPMPDPSTLSVEGEDDVPLSVVKEKQVIDKKEAHRKTSVGQSSRPARAAPATDLIGGDPDPIPRPNTGPPISKVAPKAEPAPAKATSTKDSLLGLDFFGDSPAAPPRPASTSATGGIGGGSRPDLKQSILSLYASAPKPQPPPQQQPVQSMGSFGGMASPTMPTSQPSAGLTDAFGGLSFGSTTSPKPVAADPFAGFGTASAAKPNATSSFGPLSGGSFFDNKPAVAPAPSHQKQPSNSGFGGFGGFGDLGSLSSPSTHNPPPKPSQPLQTSSMGGMADLFDLSAPPSQPAAPPSSLKPAASTTSSVFNLSTNPPKTLASPSTSTIPTATTSTSTSNLGSGGWDDSNVWGGNAWGSAEPPATGSKPAPPPSSDFGWGNSAAGSGSGGLDASSFANTSIVPGASGGFSPTPKVSADEEFGGWTSSTGVTGSMAGTGGIGGSGSGGGGGGGSGGSSSKPAGGFATNEDLFSNVWQ